MSESRHVNQDRGRTLDVSVVVPTLGRPQHAVLLSRALAALEPSPVEVLFVFQDAADLDHFVNSDVGHGSVPLLADRKSAGYARNWGLRHARSALVAFLDDDCTPRDQTWLSNLVQPLDDPRTRLSTGAVLDWHAASGRLPFTKRAFRLMPPFLEPFGRPDSTLTSTCDTVAGGNFAGRVAELRAAGGFSDAFSTPSLYEETELSRRMLRTFGGFITYVPSAAVRHSQQETGGMRVSGEGFSPDFIAQQRWILLREVYGDSPTTRARFRAYRAARWLKRHMT